MLRLILSTLAVLGASALRAPHRARALQAPVAPRAPRGLSRTPTILQAAEAGASDDAGESRVVMKFGGSSLANAERIEHVCKLVKDQIALGYRPVLVCSAMGKTTNNLISAGEFALDGRVTVDAVRTLHATTCETLDVSSGSRAEVMELMDELERLLTGVSYVRELTARAKDQLVSFGERSSVRIIASYLNSIGVPAQHFDSWDLGLTTSSEFGNAEVLPESYDLIGANLGKLDTGIVPVVTGFIGHDEEGRITTLGRGGSDLTASVLANAAKLDEIQVWKDVDGILSADPRAVPEAVPVSEVTYEEAAELAYFGAQVLHPISMMPAMAASIPVRVKNSYNPSHPGTVIRQDRDMSESLVTAITSKRDVQVVDVASTRMLGQHGFLSRVFSVFEAHQVSVDVVATSEVSISLTLDKAQTGEPLDRVVAELRKIADVNIKTDKAILSLVANVARSSEVLAIVFAVFSAEGIAVEMLSQGASKVNISFALESTDLDRATKALHKCFFEDSMCPIVHHDLLDRAAEAMQQKKQQKEEQMQD